MWQNARAMESAATKRELLITHKVLLFFIGNLYRNATLFRGLFRGICYNRVKFVRHPQIRRIDMKNKLGLILMSVVLFLALALGSVVAEPLTGAAEMWYEPHGILVGPEGGAGTGTGGG